MYTTVQYPVTMLMYISTCTVICLYHVQGTPTIESVPSTIIQGESASITCSDPGLAVIEKYNATRSSNFTVITSCFMQSSSCNLSTVAVQYNGTYTISKTSTSVSVNIANVSRDRDGGVWRCIGTGGVIDPIDIDVKVPVPCVTVISNNNLIFTDGSNTDVSCKSGVSYPPATIMWSINGGNNVGSGSTSNNSDGTTTSILQYTADKSDHNKILQCTATNGYGTSKTDSITLNIASLPKVHIEPLTNPYRVIERRQLVLTCNVDEANPSVSSNGFTWSKNGIDVTGQSSSIYRVHPVLRSDNGRFICTGKNSVGPGTSTPVQVDVLYPPIVSTPSTYQVIESTDLTLQCTATANPGNINYRWTGPGGLNSTGPILLISGIGKYKSGVYTCTATNIMIPTALPQETGKGTSTTTVTVLYGPTVTISPDNITKILENNDHRLTCTIQSNPTATGFTWYLPNGTSIPGDSELVISKRDQGGIYICEATTALVPTDGSPITRSNSATINITVLYLDPLMLTPVDEKQEGDNISITCSTNSNPVALITWYNGTTIIASKQTNINIFNIPQATCLDTGDYTCQTTNAEIPSIHHNQPLTLLIKCSPRQDTRNITTSIVSGNIRDIVQLVADVISYPPPTFTWYYNNITTGDVEPIYNDDVFKQNNTNISINTYRSTLNINITSNIYYTSYTVNVSNNIGYTQLEYHVVAQATPDVPSNISYSSTDVNICITWTPGFNGGDQQEFIVQHSVDNKTWTSSTPLSESDYCIKNLEADTPYYIRVIARNKYGDSQPVYLISSDGSSTVQTLHRVNTPAPGLPPESNTGLIAGLVVTVVVIIIIMTVVVYILVRKRKLQRGKNESSTYYAGLYLETRKATGVDDTTYQGLQHYVNLQSSSTYDVNTHNNQNYDSLQHLEPTTLYDDLNTGDDSLNTVDDSLNTVDDGTKSDDVTTTYANINRNENEKSAYVNIGRYSNI